MDRLARKSMFRHAYRRLIPFRDDVARDAGRYLAILERYEYLGPREEVNAATERYEKIKVAAWTVQELYRRIQAARVLEEQMDAYYRAGGLSL